MLRTVALPQGNEVVGEMDLIGLDFADLSLEVTLSAGKLAFIKRCIAAANKK